MAVRGCPIAVLGSGSIGVSWAIVFARAGHPVRLYDVDASTAERVSREINTKLADLATEDLLDCAPHVVAARITATFELPHGSDRCRTHCGMRTGGPGRQAGIVQPVGGAGRGDGGRGLIVLGDCGLDVIRRLFLSEPVPGGASGEPAAHLARGRARARPLHDARQRRDRTRAAHRRGHVARPGAPRSGGLSSTTACRVRSCVRRTAWFVTVSPRSPISTV